MVYNFMPGPFRVITDLFIHLKLMLQLATPVHTLFDNNNETNILIFRYLYYQKIDNKTNKIYKTGNNKLLGIGISSMKTKSIDYPGCYCFY